MPKGLTPAPMRNKKANLIEMEAQKSVRQEFYRNKRASSIKSINLKAMRNNNMRTFDDHAKQESLLRDDISV